LEEHVSEKSVKVTGEMKRPVKTWSGIQQEHH